MTDLHATSRRVPARSWYGALKREPPPFTMSLRYTRYPTRSWFAAHHTTPRTHRSTVPCVRCTRNWRSLPRITGRRSASFAWFRKGPDATLSCLGPRRAALPLGGITLAGALLRTRLRESGVGLFRARTRALLHPTVGSPGRWNTFSPGGYWNERRTCLMRPKMKARTLRSNLRNDGRSQRKSYRLECWRDTLTTSFVPTQRLRNWNIPTNRPKPRHAWRLRR